MLSAKNANGHKTIWDLGSEKKESWPRPDRRLKLNLFGVSQDRVPVRRWCTGHNDWD